MEELYHESENYKDPILSNEIQCLPNLTVDKKEIEQAIKELGIKATGNDGMTA